MPSFDDLPTDVHTIVAANLAALHPRGPPSAVFASLLTVNHAVALAASPTLGDAVFCVQFDMKALQMRYPDRLKPSVLFNELQRRWHSLKRIRWAASAGPSVWGDTYDIGSITEDMWVAYIMLTENCGRNWEQLVGWAMLPSYINAYLHWDLLPLARGSDLPEETEIRSLGLHLLAFLSDDRNPIRELDRYPELLRLIVPIAYSSYAYASVSHPWYNFTPNVVLPDAPANPTVNLHAASPRARFSRTSSLTSYLGSPVNIAIPLMSEPATYLYFLKFTQRPAFLRPLPTSSYTITDWNAIKSDPEWDSSLQDSAWARLSIDWQTPTPAVRKVSRSLPSAEYIPGSLSGNWEGIFIIPDFTSHERICNGDSPLEVYSTAYLMSHPQAWRIQEFVSDKSKSYRPTPKACQAVLPWSVERRISRSEPFGRGIPMSAYLPPQMSFERTMEGLLVSTAEGVAFYRTCDANGGANASSEAEEQDDDEVAIREEADLDGEAESESLDLIVAGEAIEPIGGFRRPTLFPVGSTLCGTVRRRDGLITVWGRPAGENNGEWIYNGRVTREAGGAIVWSGTWRVRQDQPASIVLEGVFKLHRVP